MTLVIPAEAGIYIIDDIDPESSLNQVQARVRNDIFE